MQRENWVSGNFRKEFKERFLWEIMAIIKNISKIKTEQELMEKAGWLRGKTLFQVEEAIKESDKTSRVKTKGNVGYVIEKGFFGIKINSEAKPDIEHLGIEIKTCPLKHVRGSKYLNVKEPLSLGIINYKEEVNNHKIEESKLYKKNKKILIVCYIHDGGVDRSNYIIKYVFIWNMNDEVIKEIEPDYLKIVKKIQDGEAHEIHQPQHKNLTLCPKHGGHKKNLKCTRWCTTQPNNRDEKVEIKAFRFKNKYMNFLIARHLGKKLLQKGNSTFWEEN